MARASAQKFFRRSKRLDFIVVRCCPRSGHHTTKDCAIDAISSTGDFYLHKCCLIIAKFCEKTEYIYFINIGPIIKSPRL